MPTIEMNRECVPYLCPIFFNIGQRYPVNMKSTLCALCALSIYLKSQ